MAQFALVWPLPSVHPLMVHHVPFPRKAFLAELALVWPLPCVHPLMVHHVPFPSKAFLAELAGVGLLPRVHPFVNNKFRRPEEGPLADTARDGFPNSVRLLVEDQAALAGVPVRAQLARKGLDVTVCHFMSIPVYLPGKRFATNAAYVAHLSSVRSFVIPEAVPPMVLLRTESAGERFFAGVLAQMGL